MWKKHYLFCVVFDDGTFVQQWLVIVFVVECIIRVDCMCVIDGDAETLSDSHSQPLSFALISILLLLSELHRRHNARDEVVQHTTVRADERRRADFLVVKHGHKTHVVLFSKIIFASDDCLNVKYEQCINKTKFHC